MKTADFRVGVGLDAGGLNAVALNIDGRPCAERRVELPMGDYRTTIGSIAEVIAAIESDIGAAGMPVGVAAPGRVDSHSGRIRDCHAQWLNQATLPADLESAVGRSVRVVNHADSLAVSESSDGVGQGCQGLFAAMLDADIDGGLVINGELVSGHNGLAGVWGHNNLPWPSASEARQPPRCWCGLDGCIETWLSAPGMAADYLRRGGSSLTAHDIVAHAEAGERLAGATLRDWLARLARAFAMVINIVDPEVIVCSGSLAEIRWLYSEIPKIWSRHSLADSVRTRLVPAHHGHLASARGAARMGALQTVS